MSGNESEIRELQRAIFGRGGVATKDQLEELAVLQGAALSRYSSAAALAEVGEGEGAEDSPSVALSSKPRRRMGAWIWGTAGIGLLGIGLVAGVGIGLAAARTPIAHVVPPSVEMFDTDTVVYFGEVENSRVWAGLDQEGNRCLIAAFPAHDGGNVACERDGSTVTVFVPDEASNTTVQYVVVFDDKGQLPSLTATRM